MSTVPADGVISQCPIAGRERRSAAPRGMNDPVVEDVERGSCQVFTLRLSGLIVALLTL